MSYPIALRDKLYEIFLQAHRLKDGPALFEERIKPLKRIFSKDRRYLEDRARRYLKVIKARKSAPPGDVAGEVELARLLFKNGLYFDAHEYLETAWKRSSGSLKLRLQGLIQLAAAMHKRELDSKARAGVSYLVSKGFEKLSDL